MNKNINVANVENQSAIETLVTSLVENKVNEFKGFALKTVENFLEMSRVIYEAKAGVSTKHKKTLFTKTDYKLFLEMIGMGSDSKKSSLKKFVLVGQNYSNLKKHSENLPDNWTTVYEISRIAPPLVDGYFKAGLITVQSSGRSMKTLNGTNTVSEIVEKVESVNLVEVQNVTSGGYTFSCEIKDINDVALKANLNMILRSLKDLNVELSLSPELTSLLEPKLATAA
jgi:hypothetical protein